MPVGVLTLKCASSRIAKQPKSRLPLCRTEPRGSELRQYGLCLFFCWLVAGPCTRAIVLPPTCFRIWILTAQTHTKCSGSFLGRATYAALRILITRSDNEKRTLNVVHPRGAYFGRDRHCLPSILEALPFDDVQNVRLDDWQRRGTNLFHEFAPGIRQMVKNRAPRFGYRIEERITNDGTPRGVVTTSR